MKLPTEQQTRRFLSLLEHGLSSGLGQSEPGKMCIEACWCVALDMPHGDNPGEDCVLPFFREQKININDFKGWSSPKARAEGMRQIGVAQVGSGDIDPIVAESSFKHNLNRFVLPFLIKQHLIKEPTNEFLLKQQELLKVASTKKEFKKIRINCYNCYNYYYYYYNYNYYYYNRDEFALLLCKALLETLIECKSPGCQYLWLCDLPREELLVSAKSL